MATTRAARSSLWALVVAVRAATLELKLSRLAWAIERRYRVDQPRAPAGTPEGGQWVEDRVHVAQTGPRCDGFSSGCQFGGSFGTTGMFRIFGRYLCWDCAVKYFSLEDLTGAEQMEYLIRLDPTYRQRGK